MKKFMCMQAALMLAVCGLSSDEDTIRKAKLRQMSVEDTLVPIRPGGINRRPFWNTYAKQFIYVPSFEFKQIPGAKSYRFTVKDRFQVARSFTADTPYALLTPVWSQLPAGPVSVTVEALDGSGKPLGSAGRRTFYRNEPFNDSYPPRRFSYAESARKAYQYLFHLKPIQELAAGRIDLDYPLFCYPSKIHASIIKGMIRYAEMEPSQRENALKIARNAAEHLIQTAVPAGTPLEYLPQTYEGDALTAKQYAGTIRMQYPADVGSAMLNLYKATGEKRYLDYARRIGDQYLRMQLPSGHWHMVLKIADGSRLAPNYCAPTGIMMFLEKLAGATRQEKYRTAAEKASATMKDMMESFDWEGRFEDVMAQSTPYQNLTMHDAINLYLYLGKRKPSDPEILKGAREIQRFAEDQFIIWEQPGWTGHESPFRTRTLPELQSDNWGLYLWATPCALEQYRCYTPVDGAAAKIIRCYLFLYDREKNPLDLAKARALGDAITRFQEPQGRIPTWCDWKRPVSEDWINCAFGTADVMEMLSKYDSIR